MGAGASKVENDEQAINVPIQFSQNYVNHLADASVAPGPAPERQALIDAQIHSRIQAELSRLRQEEEEVQREINTALERENIGHGLRKEETSREADESGDARSLNSILLLGDVRDVRQKVQKVHGELDIAKHQSAERSAENLSTCYRNKHTFTLDCWREVAEFKGSVARMENGYINSLQ